MQWLQRALPSGAKGVLAWVGGKRDLQAHSSPSHMKPALAPTATGSLYACFLSSKTGNRMSRQKQEVPRLQHPGDEYQVSAPVPTAPCTLTLPRGRWTRLTAEPGPCPFACMSAESRGSGTEMRAASWFPCNGFSPRGLQMRKHLAEDRVQESVRGGASWVSPHVPCGAPWRMKPSPGQPRRQSPSRGERQADGGTPQMFSTLGADAGSAPASHAHSPSTPSPSTPSPALTLPLPGGLGLTHERRAETGRHPGNTNLPSS